MKATCMFAAIILVPMSLLAQTPAPRKEATVHVRVVDVLGTDLGSPRIRRFQSLTNDHDLASKFRDGTATNVPFGDYRLDASSIGFSSAQRNVPVYENDVWVVLGLDVGTIDFPLPTRQLSGAIRNFDPRGATIWLRLVSVHTGFIADAKVSDGGNFTMAGIPPGFYVLIAVQEAKVRATTVISVPTADPISLGLNQAQ